MASAVARHLSRRAACGVQSQRTRDFVPVSGCRTARTWVIPAPLYTLRTSPVARVHPADEVAGVPTIGSCAAFLATSVLTEALAPPPLSRTTRAVGPAYRVCRSAMGDTLPRPWRQELGLSATVPKARSELDLCRERWPGRRVSVQGAPCGLGLGEGKTPSTWVVHRVARAQRSLRAESVTPSTERPLAPEFRVAGRPSPTSTATGAGFQRRRPQVRPVRATPDPRRR